MQRKPRIALLATGGTIAGTAAEATQTTGYHAGALSLEALLQTVPNLTELADLQCETLAAIDSKDLQPSLWQKLSARAETLLANDCDGLVITHGTDTMEETAYYLHLTLHTHKPVVLTGAMLPATALSADGPRNLLDAVRVAASPDASDKGVLVVFQGEIHSARAITKTQTLAVTAFQSPGFGALGFVEGTHVRFYQSPLRLHTYQSVFQALQDTWSFVPILYAYAGDDGTLARLAWEHGAKAMVYAGMGNGSIPEKVEAILQDITAAGIPVVRASRSVQGAVIEAEVSYQRARFIPAGTLSPQKARLLLMLALQKTQDHETLQKFFATY